MGRSNRKRARCPVLRCLRIARGQRGLSRGSVLRGFGGALFRGRDALRLGFEPGDLGGHHGFGRARAKRPQIGQRLIPVALANARRAAAIASAASCELGLAR